MRIATQSNKVSWTVAAAAGLEWAKKVFPNAAVMKKQLISFGTKFSKLAVSTEADPVKAWEEHAAILKVRLICLIKRQFSALHYTAPGTDLTLGLPKNHVWESAGAINAQGEGFLPNMPTEGSSQRQTSVVQMVMSSTKPLSYNGNIIEGIKVTFKDGQIVDISAEKGDQVMKDLVFGNAGARALGECALVPDPSQFLSQALPSSTPFLMRMLQTTWLSVQPMH